MNRCALDKVSVVSDVRVVLHEEHHWIPTCEMARCVLLVLTNVN